MTIIKDLKKIGGTGKGVQKTDVFQEFVIWSCKSEDERMKEGLETQGDFAQKHNVTEATLSLWKSRDDFKMLRGAFILEWGKRKTPTVLKSTYKQAVTGNVFAQAIWLKYFEGFESKDSNAAGAAMGGGPMLSENDVRFFISLLPEEKRRKYYDTLHELLAELQYLRQVGLLQDAAVAGDGPESDIQGEADQPAQGVPVAGNHALSQSYQNSVCENMEWKTLSNHHKGASWRG